MKEADFQKKVINLLETEHPAETFNVHGGRYQDPGWSDLIIFYSGGYTTFLELKVERNQCTARQRSKLQRMSRLGFRAYVLRAKSKTPRGQIGHATEYSVETCGKDSKGKGKEVLYVSCNLRDALTYALWSKKRVQKETSG